jgi:histone-lysine N-methyltransferase SETMAR
MRVARITAAPKTMLTVFSSIHGAIFIDWPAPGETFNNIYFHGKILEPLSQVRHKGHSTSSPRPILHFDNASLHRSAVTENCFSSWQFRHAPQPAYSPDISPCDFFRFGDLKSTLKDEKLKSMEEL